MVTRTDQLFFGTVAAAGSSFVYTVPASTRTIVKSIMVQEGGAFGTIVVRFWSPAGAFVQYFAKDTTRGVLPQLLLEFWAVLGEGDRIEVQTSTPDVHVLISGTELPITP